MAELASDRPGVRSRRAAHSRLPFANRRRQPIVASRSRARTPGPHAPLAYSIGHDCVARGRPRIALTSPTTQRQTILPTSATRQTARWPSAMCSECWPWRASRALAACARGPSESATATAGKGRWVRRRVHGSPFDAGPPSRPVADLRQTVKKNVAPWSTSETAQICPPCRWTMRCVRANPTLVPS